MGASVYADALTGLRLCRKEYVREESYDLIVASSEQIPVFKTPLRGGSLLRC